MMLQNLLLTGSSAFVTAERTAMHHASPIPSLKIGGSDGSRTHYLSACKADAFATLEPQTHLKSKNQDVFFLDGLEPKSPLYSRGVLPIELYTQKVDTLIIFAVYVFKIKFTYQRSNQLCN